MKTNVRPVIHLFAGAVGVGAVLLISSSAQAQNLFAANWYFPGTISQITPVGSTSTFASGSLGEPEGLAFDSASNLFVADSYAGSIYEIAPDGTQTTFASGLGDVNSLAFNAAGDLFTCDYYNGDIYEFTPAGAQSTFATGLASPGGLAFNAAGDLFASDASGNIYEYTPGGTRSTFASGIAGPSALAFSSTGDLYVTYAGTGPGNGGVAKITPGAVISTFATGLYGPSYLAFDTTGNLFVADGTSGNIIEITPDGSQSTFATGFGNATGLAFQGITLPVTAPSVSGSKSFNASLSATSFSINSAGNLTSSNFGNQDLIRECANEMGITNLKVLHLVYDPNADALEVVSGSDTNQTVVCTPLTFSESVSLTNTKATMSERQAWVYWESNANPVGMLTATELYGYGVSNKLTSFSLSGQLQFAVPGSGTNASTIYRGSLAAH